MNNQGFSNRNEVNMSIGRMVLVLIMLNYMKQLNKKNRKLKTKLKAMDMHLKTLNLKTNT